LCEGTQQASSPGPAADIALAATAAEHGITLATRNRRAAETYRALDIDFELID
jgi:predicted nucleic acid-binding protein